MAEKLRANTLMKLEAGDHGDGGGLYLRVQESGSRSWVLRTVVKGKRREIGLGGLSSRTLAEARELAAELRARARRGEDIMESRRIEKRVIPTFEAAAITVHENLKPTLDETHAYNWLQSLKTYVFPHFGNKTVDAIDSADVLRAIAPIWNDVHETADRTLARIKNVFDYCITAGYRTQLVNGIAVTLPNPCDAIRRGLPKANGGENHHPSMPYMELPAFIQKLRSAKNALSIKLGLEFLILTVARTGEVLGAKWNEIDFDDCVWTVPAERMKMRKEHRVPLSPRCLEMLQLAKQFHTGGDYIFQGRYEGHPLSQQAFIVAMRRMGHGDVVPHGFRASFKTWAEEKTKYDTLVIEAAQAHQVQGIERHYLRTTFFEERKKLMKAWAAFATAAPIAKVVSIS